jgi:hypothetical protein
MITKQTTMKTTISALMIMILTIPALAALDQPPKEMRADVDLTEFVLEDEANVNDIPFDTKEVVRNLEAELEEEAYANDIPFDTKAIVLGLETQLAEEAYVDDIPFNTLDVMLLEGIAMEEEEEVNDIPFSTSCIVQTLKRNSTNWDPCMIQFDGRTFIWETKTEGTSASYTFKIRF